MGYNVYFDIHEAANWRILITGETTRSCELIEDLVKIFDIPFTNRHLKIKPFVFLSRALTVNLQLICRLDTRRFHVQMPDLRIRCGHWVTWFNDRVPQ